MGYDDSVAESARLTDSRDELTEDEISELNANLNRLLDSLDEQPEISVTYFVPDEKKSGGRYAEKVGTVRIEYMTATPTSLCSRTVCGLRVLIWQGLR